MSLNEQALLSIVDGSHHHHGTMRCSEGMASAFSCAVRSARIMIAKVLVDRIGPHRPSSLAPMRLEFAGGERLFDWKVVNARNEQPGQPSDSLRA